MNLDYDFGHFGPASRIDVGVVNTVYNIGSENIRRIVRLFQLLVLEHV